MLKDSILVGYVTGNEVDRAFMASVFNFMSHDAANRKLVLGLGDQPGLYVDDNRNNLIRKILPAPFEWFLSLDTDIVFKPEVPYLLLDWAKQRGEKIVSALYFTFLHNGAVKPCWFNNADNGSVRNIGEIVIGQAYPLAAVGMGCALIHRSVFEAFLTEPAFANDTWTWFGRDLYGPPTDTAHTGEDISFCRRAAKLGFPTWGLTTAIVTHCKRFEIDFDVFRILYEANYKDVRGIEMGPVEKTLLARVSE